MQLDISASSEGDQNMNISKVLFTGTQVKQMRERADTLLLRLQRLADKHVCSDIDPSSHSVNVTYLHFIEPSHEHHVVVKLSGFADMSTLDWIQGDTSSITHNWCPCHGLLITPGTGHMSHSIT